MTRILDWSILVIGVMFASNPAFGQTLLRLKFQPDEILRYEIRQTITQIIEQNSQPTLKQQAEQILDTKTTTLEVANNRAIRKERIARLRLKLSADDATSTELDFDSMTDRPVTGPFESMVAHVLRPLSETSWTATVSEAGEMTNVQIPKTLADAFRQHASGPLLSELASEDGLKRTSVQAHFVLPDFLVSKGDTWDQVIGLKSPLGLFSMKRRFEFMDQDSRGIVRVTYRTSISLVPRPNATVNAQLKTATGTGEFRFDNQTGRLIDLRGSQTVEMAVGIGDETVPQKTTIETVIKLRADAADENP